MGWNRNVRYATVHENNDRKNTHNTTIKTDSETQEGYQSIIDPLLLFSGSLDYTKDDRNKL